MKIRNGPATVMVMALQADLMISHWMISEKVLQESLRPKSGDLLQCDMLSPRSKGGLLFAVKTAAVIFVDHCGFYYYQFFTEENTK